eukprot:Hpha_TRINITY_DN23421_c0_g1::TRINITY_DN23421_c0_g1_i1::g.114011::m.114011
MPAKQSVPKEQWRARSKKSRVQRIHRLKNQVLAANLEKVENLQYKEERRERDKERLGKGQKQAGHHNLPEHLLKDAPKAVTAQPVRKNVHGIATAVGFISRNALRRYLLQLYAVEKA